MELTRALNDYENFLATSTCTVGLLVNAPHLPSPAALVTAAAAAWRRLRPEYAFLCARLQAVTDAATGAPVMGALGPTYRYQPAAAADAHAASFAGRTLRGVPDGGPAQSLRDRVVALGGAGPDTTRTLARADVEAWVDAAAGGGAHAAIVLVLCHACSDAPGALAVGHRYAQLLGAEVAAAAAAAAPAGTVAATDGDGGVAAPREAQPLIDVQAGLFAAHAGSPPDDAVQLPPALRAYQDALRVDGGGGGGGDAATAASPGAASRLWARLGLPSLGWLGAGSLGGGTPTAAARSPTHAYVRLGMEAGVAADKAGAGWGLVDPPVDNVAYFAAAYERHAAAKASRKDGPSPSEAQASHRVRFATPAVSQDLAPALLAGSGVGGLSSRQGGYATSPWYQLWVLLHRAYLLEVRDAHSLAATVAQTAAIAALLGVTFLQVGRSAAYTTGAATGVTTVIRLLGTYGVLVGVLAVVNVHTTFPTERLIMLRERAAHSYRTSVYFVAYSVRGMARGVLLSVLMTVLMATLVGLRWRAFPAIITLVVLLWAAYESLALVVAAAVDDIKTAVSVTPSVFCALVLYSGFLIQADRLPGALRWVHRVSFPGYAFSGMVRAQLAGATFDAPLECMTCASSGDRALTSYGIGSAAGGVWGNAAALAGTVAVLRLVGYAVVLARGPSFAKTM